MWNLASFFPYKKGERIYQLSAEIPKTDMYIEQKKLGLTLCVCLCFLAFIYSQSFAELYIHGFKVKVIANSYLVFSE